MSTHSKILFFPDTGKPKIILVYDRTFQVFCLSSQLQLSEAFIGVRVAKHVQKIAGGNWFLFMYTENSIIINIKIKLGIINLTEEINEK